MENASKALIMAGSVLLALLVIGALVFMFNTLSNLKTEEARNDEVLKIIEYNKQIQTYNRVLYGPELISLANLIQDYNYRQATLDTYSPIEIKVNMDGLNEESTFENEYTDVEKLINDYKNLENTLNDYRKIVKIGNTNVGKSAFDWSGMTENQRIAYLGKFPSDDIDNIKGIMDSYAYEYDNVKATSNNFKNRKFRPTLFKTDDNMGIVIQIEFELIT